MSLIDRLQHRWTEKEPRYCHKKDWTQSIKGKLSQGFCTQQNMTSNYTLMVICQKTKLEKNW